jgi:MIP family channel proteins
LKYADRIVLLLFLDFVPSKMSMTEDEFVPSSSLDSHTMPMDARIPLIKISPNKQRSVNNNTATFAAANNNKSDRSLAAQVISNNSNQSPSNETRLSNTCNKWLKVSQLKTLSFYQALFSEFLGTMLLTLVATSTGLPIASKSVPDLNGALASGLVVSTIIVGLGHVSGAHINPAVTLSFLAVAEIDIIRALFYIAIQLLGAISASSLLKSIAPPKTQGYLGMTMITDDVSVADAVIVEVIITFILCFTVHAICDKRRDDIGGSKVVAVGIAVVIGCLFGGPYTGASMNPARSFGPAVAMNLWKNHWVYWIGPLVGSALSALVYRFLFRKQSPTVVRSDLNTIEATNV